MTDPTIHPSRPEGASGDELTERMAAIRARTEKAIDYNSDTDPRVREASARAAEIVSLYFTSEWGENELDSLISSVLIDVHKAYAADLACLLDALGAVQAQRVEARAGYDRLMEALTAQTVLGARMAGVVAAARAVLGMGTPALLGLALNDLRSALRVLDREEPAQ